jgi:hypothetical protein
LYRRTLAWIKATQRTGQGTTQVAHPHLTRLFGLLRGQYRTDHIHVGLASCQRRLTNSCRRITHYTRHTSLPQAALQRLCRPRPFWRSFFKELTRGPSARQRTLQRLPLHLTAQRLRLERIRSTALITKVVLARDAGFSQTPLNIARFQLAPQRPLLRCLAPSELTGQAGFRSLASQALSR